MVACILPPDISGTSGTVTGPSHSPARLLMVAKDFCASVWVVAASAAKAIAALERMQQKVRCVVSYTVS